MKFGRVRVNLFIQTNQVMDSLPCSPIGMLVSLQMPGAYFLKITIQTNYMHLQETIFESIVTKGGIANHEHFLFLQYGFHIY